MEKDEMQNKNIKEKASEYYLYPFFMKFTSYPESNLSVNSFIHGNLFCNITCVICDIYQRNIL